MAWPSERIPPGGIFHPAKVTYNPETKIFLKVLLDESKLTMMQRKKGNYLLRSDDHVSSIQSRRSTTSLSRDPPIVIRPGSSKKRSQTTIVQSGAYVREKFVPLHPKIDREKVKKHLQDFMAYGKELRPSPRKPHCQRRPKKEDGPEMNRFDQLVEEIRERREFLTKMKELGETDKYKTVIEQQIEGKLREMKNLSSQGGKERK